MNQTELFPLAHGLIPPHIASLPKVDLHIHQEQTMRLDRVRARREGRAPYDWRSWVERLMTEEPPGYARLAHIATVKPVPVEHDTFDQLFLARVEDLLVEAAADGAILVEVRVSNDTVLRPRFYELFQEAQHRVQLRYRQFNTVAIVTLLLELSPEVLERVIDTCIVNGIKGVDLIYRPYATEADWTPIYRVAERVAAAGLGITAHAGEVSSANIAQALRTPGLTRLGHATYAGYDPHLLELIARSAVTVECSLTCNVVTGAAESYETHPIRQFVAAGVPVALGSDDPVQVCTTIGREYAIAAVLGFTADDLLGFTRNAVRASFAPAARREALLAALDAQQNQQGVWGSPSMSPPSRLG